MTKFFIAATAGHVDHGKSALVKSLTGVDPDRLPEEKRRGMTLDLGFAHLELTRPDEPGQTLSIGLIDVPGHGDLVKNMVPGFAAVDLALLVVAADDGWMPQTEEHFQILNFLRVPELVVVLSKADLAVRLEETMSAVREHLRGSHYDSAAIIPTSTKTGAGVTELKAVLSEKFFAQKEQVDIGKPRLGVDRVFELHGIGTVATGTLTGGCLERGQEVLLQPTGTRCRIRSLQSYGREVKRAQPGTRVALNLALKETEPGMHSPLGRGTVITRDGLGSPGSLMHVWIERWPARKFGPEFKSVKNGLRVSVHLGAEATPARIFLGQPSPLERGSACAAELRFERPVFAFAGDRFIVRDWSEQWTLAGGIIIDSQPGGRPFRSPAQQQFLQRGKDGWASAAGAIDAILKRDGTVHKPGLLLQSKYSSAEVETAVVVAAESQAVVLNSDWIVESGTWKSLVDRAAELVRSHHKQHPHQAGVPRAQVVSSLCQHVSVLELADTAVDALLKDGFVQNDSVLREKTHVSTLPKQHEQAAAEIRRELRTKPLDPPLRATLARDPAHREALLHLISTGEVLSVSPDLVLDSGAVSRAKDIVVQLLRSRGACSVAEIRDALGSTRRVVVPLLEYLDRCGVTRRELDKRVLRKP